MALMNSESWVVGGSLYSYIDPNIWKHRKLAHQKSQSMCILLYKHSNFVEAIMLDFDNMYIDENNLIQREQVDHGEYALIFKRKS